MWWPKGCMIQVVSITPLYRENITDVSQIRAYSKGFGAGAECCCGWGELEGVRVGGAFGYYRGGAAGCYPGVGAYDSAAEYFGWVGRGLFDDHVGAYRVPADH